MKNRASEQAPNRLVRGIESAPPKTIGIIGHGHFGALVETLAERFGSGIAIKVFSPEGSPDNKRFFDFEKVASSDLVVLAVPIGAMEEVLKRIAPLIRPETVVVDVATVKVYSTALIEHIIPGQPFVSMHPMFGPESYKKKEGDVSGFKIAVTKQNLPEKGYAAWRLFLETCGAEVIEMSAEEHDKLLAETLFLTHLIGQIISRAGFARTKIDTVSFGSLMDAVESVQDDTELFRDVFRYNSFCKDVLERFGISEEEVHALLSEDTAEPIAP